MKNYFWLWTIVGLHVVFWTLTLRLHPALSTGDNGRDLYAFWMTSAGAWPCRDYWWQYGPLVPLYYATWFRLLGANLMTVRLALGVIYLLLSLLTYQTLRLFIAPGIAFLSSLAFFSFDMTWTYNHVAAVVFMLTAIYCLWKFFLSRHPGWVYAGGAALVGCGLVKVSAGVYSFTAFYSALVLDHLLTRRKEERESLAWKHFFFLPLGFSLPLLGAYFLLYRGISLDWVHQCITVDPKYRFWSNSPGLHFKHLVLRFLVWQPERMIGVALLLILGVFAWFGFKKTVFRGEMAVRILISLFLFALVNSLDYFLTGGLIYRFDFLMFPMWILLAGLGMHWASPLFIPKVRVFLGGLLFFLVLWFPFGRNLREAFAWRVPERFLDVPHGQVYLGGLLPEVEVVKKATSLIREKVGPEKEILTLPYDSLYCFLSSRRQAVPELMFFQHIFLSLEQEKRIIETLESKEVPLVLISNRYRSPEGGIGQFGVTHARTLAEYIFDRYGEFETIGEWDEGNPRIHAVKIFLRKNRDVKRRP